MFSGKGSPPKDVATTAEVKRAVASRWPQLSATSEERRRCHRQGRPAIQIGVFRTMRLGVRQRSGRAGDRLGVFAVGIAIVPVTPRAPWSLIDRRRGGGLSLLDKSKLSRSRCSVSPRTQRSGGEGERRLEDAAAGAARIQSCWRRSPRAGRGGNSPSAFGPSSRLLRSGPRVAR